VFWFDPSFQCLGGCNVRWAVSYELVYEYKLLHTTDLRPQSINRTHEDMTHDSECKH